jgi:molybdopterin converting factor small subunit
VKVLFYGRLAEAIGPELEIAAPPGCSVAEVRDRIVVDHPEIEHVLRSKHARICVAEMLVHDDYRIATDDTLEFLPPVSGG